MTSHSDNSTSDFDFSPERSVTPKRRKFHPIKIFIVCLVGLAVLGYWFSGPAIPPGSFYCKRFRTVELHIGNPRKAGTQVDRLANGPSGAPAVREEHFNYYVRVCVFHAADGAEPKVVSRLVVSHPRRFGCCDPAEIRAIRPMSEVHFTLGYPDIDIPEREVGGRTIVLLLPLNEKLGWRVLRFDTHAVPDSIRVEDVDRLPLAKTDPDGAVCLPIARQLAIGP